MAEPELLDHQIADVLAQGFLDKLEPYPHHFRGRGIVTCAGGVKYYPSAWVLIKMLRTLGCQLPIQVWYLGEAERDEQWISLVEPLGVECVDAFEVRKRHPHPRLYGWECKPYAILHCPFEEVLFLDADNLPVHDPTYLFDDPRYQSAGAVFWPDARRMSPKNESWQIFAVPYRDEPEQESGQVLVHKAHCWAPLHLCNWYNEHSDYYYRFIHGDKDTFRFAWHRLNRPFAAPSTGPTRLKGTLHQVDLDGRPLFQHRCHGKWSLGRNDPLEGFAFEDHCRQFVEELKARWNPSTLLTKRLTPDDRRQMDALKRHRWEVVSEGFDKTALHLNDNALIDAPPNNAVHFWWVENGSLVLAAANGNPTARLSRQPDGSWQGRCAHKPMLAFHLVPTTPDSITTGRPADEGPCLIHCQKPPRHSSRRKKGSTMTDVVYPLGTGSVWNDNELRYSLRSIEQNLRDLGRVFVVGQKPDWLINAIHIPMEDIHTKNKDANLIDKVLAACRADVSDRFVRLSDDQCLLQPRLSKELKAYHLGRLEEKPAAFWGDGRWKRRLRRTYGLLLHEGQSTFHYDSHIPMVYERDRFVQVMTNWPYQQGLGYCINTLYFNNVPMKKRHAMRGHKLTVEMPLSSADEIRARLIGKTYLGYNNAGLNDAMKAVLADLFPEPSRFESPVALGSPPEVPQHDPDEALAAVR